MCSFFLYTYSFSRNGEPTIVPVNPNIPLTALGGLQMTPYDIYELNSAYDCPRNLRLPTRCPFDHLPQFLLAKPRASLTPEKPCISIQSPDHPETTYTDKDIVLSYDFQVHKSMCEGLSNLLFVWLLLPTMSV